MIELLLTLLVLVVVFGIAWVILQRIPLPDPFNWVAQIVLLLILLIAVIAYLLPLVRVTRLP